MIDAARQTAVGADLAFSAIEAPRLPLTRFLNWSIIRLHRATRYDAQVSIAFLKVINMLAPPPAILHPRILWRVLKGSWHANWHANWRTFRRTATTTVPAQLDPSRTRESD